MMREEESGDTTPMADADILNLMYTLCDGSVPYPIDSERLLLEAIKSGNKTEAQRLLNQLLGNIYFCSGCDFGRIKVRVTELLVLLSRASIEGGAGIGDIFGLSEDLFREINQLNNLEDLSVWLSGAMHRYISYVFDFLKVKHSDAIFKTTQYVRGRFAEKLTLDDIAKNVYLSKSYLCKLFKEEVGLNITAFINKVRVEKSKALLLDHTLSIVDIAAMTGFVDQSYFTKVFKKITGSSPGKYRESSGKSLQKS
jgi:AraC-like DNA-binding protein